MSTDPHVVDCGTPAVRLTVDAGVAELRLDRPRVNAIDAEVVEGLRRAADWLSTAEEAAAVVLTGGDRVFAAGADIKQMAGLDHAAAVGWSGRLQSTFAMLAGLPQPVVAAVAGYALGGGCELALCADVRFAAEDAVLGQPEILLGVIPGAGGTQRLSRLVGPSRAKELVLTGRQVPAPEALAIGLVDRVLPAGEVLAAAHEWARQFVGGPRLALRAAKEAVDQGLEVALPVALEIERQQFAALFATEDRTRGMQSFLERGPGKAEFRGR
ncbi:enoyl-CoA hydratase/isomerase family protein [Auraticoccus sp. F435]|uniref:enoyl-CoA hydratase n=1 Tax=Auraticoccus cholistanensis TaxID=2656650 RepID=A0A6A9UWF5_9ACTN|nr:enoyl-CoA hydratase-related protein [Auraticoccus cholistanensis]MVA76005.1 enoyl-CoA hydratase/isomerase family protein [Auraticoccus cholistanensis]